MGVIYKTALVLYIRSDRPPPHMCPARDCSDSAPAMYVHHYTCFSNIKKREPLQRMTLGEIRRRPTLPGRFQPSTISALRLNFCVRDGNRWIPQAIVTGNMGLSRSRSLRFRSSFALAPLPLRPSLRSPFRFASLSSHPQNRTGPLSLPSA